MIGQTYKDIKILKFRHVNMMVYKPWSVGFMLC